METQLTVLQNPPSPERMEPVRNGWLKPYGGLWTSTLVNDTESAWVRWCREYMRSAIYGRARYALEVDPRARIYTIDSLDDLVRLYEQGYAIPFAPGVSVYSLDFERLAQLYDGLHLTARGERETRMSYPHTLYGWDVESTVWFRWVFTDVRRVYP